MPAEFGGCWLWTRPDSIVGTWNPADPDTYKAPATLSVGEGTRWNFRFYWMVSGIGVGDPIPTGDLTVEWTEDPVPGGSWTELWGVYGKSIVPGYAIPATEPEQVRTPEYVERYYTWREVEGWAGKTIRIRCKLESIPSVGTGYSQELLVTIVAAPVVTADYREPVYAVVQDADGIAVCADASLASVSGSAGVIAGAHDAVARGVVPCASRAGRVMDGALGGAVADGAARGIVSDGSVGATARTSLGAAARVADAAARARVRDGSVEVR